MLYGDRAASGLTAALRRSPATRPAARPLSAVELMEQGLERISRFDDDRAGRAGLRAVITINPNARAEAEASDARRVAGAPLSGLDGVTFTVKDCIEVAGMPTTHGSPLFADWIPAADAPAVARLRAAGMVLLAKVALDDFAAACFGECSVRGVMRNPYDGERMVSGSSGGSAVSVAVGYAPLSLGTDTGGSLRIPAALTSVATLRPTLGLVPAGGVFPISAAQDVVGPMALSVAGLRMAMAALAALPLQAGATRLAGKRLGVVCGGLAIWGDDPGGPVLRRFDEVCQALQDAGAELVRVDAPPRALLDSSSLITQQATRSARDYFAARPDAPVRDLAELYATGAFSRWAAVGLGRAVSFDPDSPAGAQACRDALAARDQLRAHTGELFARERLDAVLYPSVQRVASRIGVEQSGVFTRWSENTGRPAVGVPMGLVLSGDSALPLSCSLELLGAENADAALLDLAEAVESVIGVYQRRDWEQSCRLVI
jgi:amidase